MEREVSEVDRRLIIKRTYLDKINYYLTRNSTEPEELYTLVRRFFSDYLKLDYEFTYEELSQELNKIFIRPKIKEHVDDFLIRLSESEYLEENALSVVGVNSFLRELDEIIRNVIFDDQEVKEEETSVLQKVLNIKPKLREKTADVPSFRLVIEEINFYILNGQTDMAKKSYMDLSKAYEKLSKTDKKTLHDDMNNVYEKLQSAVRNPQTQAVQNEILSAVVKKLNEDIDETLFYINAGNFESAKNSYAETLKVYESLNPDDKKIIHKKLDETYQKLQALSSRPKHINAEPKLAVKTTDSISAYPDDLSTNNSNIDTTTVGENIDNLVQKNISSAVLPTISQTTDAFSNISSSDISDYSFDSDDSLDFNQKNSTNIPAKPVNTMDSVTLNARTGKVDAKSAAIYAAVEEKIMTKTPVFSKTETGNSLFQAEEDNDAVRAITIGFDNTSSSQSLDDIPSDNRLVSSDTKAQDKKAKEMQKFATKKSLTTHTGKELIGGELPTSEIFDTSRINKSVSTVSIEKITSSSVPAVFPSPTIFPNPNVAPNIIPNVEAVIPAEIRPPVFDTFAQFKQSSIIEKMNLMLKKINDDILLGRLENASETYKDALALYKSMNTDEKKQCYKELYDKFKNLDEEMHKKSLGEILDTHLSASKDYKRTLMSRREISDRDSVPKNIESLKISQEGTTLPIALGNTPETTRIYELIEESYFNMSNRNVDLAMLKYFKALEFYRTLSVIEKKKLYSNLRELFLKLSALKSVR